MFTRLRSAIAVSATIVRRVRSIRVRVAPAIVVVVVVVREAHGPPRLGRRIDGHAHRRAAIARAAAAVLSVRRVGFVWVVVRVRGATAIRSRATSTTRRRAREFFRQIAVRVGLGACWRINTVLLAICISPRVKGEAQEQSKSNAQRRRISSSVIDEATASASGNSSPATRCFVFLPARLPLPPLPPPAPPARLK